MRRGHSYNRRRIYLLPAFLQGPYRQEPCFSDFGGRSLYEVVKDGDWTYDKLFAAAKKCAAITSGGTAMTLDDTWGMGILAAFR